MIELQSGYHSPESEEEIVEHITSIGQCEEIIHLTKITIRLTEILDDPEEAELLKRMKEDLKKYEKHLETLTS